MTKQIEDYPELEKLTSNLREWSERSESMIFFYDDAECDQMCLVEDVENKLLEQQSKIDSLTEQNKELIDCLKMIERATPLWLPSQAHTEHEDEAKALHTMRDNYLELLNKEAK